MIEILHRDAHLVAVNKPAGLAVHRSHYVGPTDDYLVDAVARVIDVPLFLAHRLDRATSGVLLVARSREIAAQLGQQLMDRSVGKDYLAVVRGWPEESGCIDHPLSGASLKGPAREARTHWRRLATVELPIAMGRYEQQRYALLAVQPETGRYQQIRRHFAHASHHLIGDTTHGRGDHNRLFRIHWAMHRLLLHAWRLSFDHPLLQRRLCIEAPLDASWRRIVGAFGWEPALGDAAAAGPMNPHANAEAPVRPDATEHGP
jgi:tRNA pseudouridine65 synthase